MPGGQVVRRKVRAPESMMPGNSRDPALAVRAGDRKRHRDLTVPHLMIEVRDKGEKAG